MKDRDQDHFKDQEMQVKIIIEDTLKKNMKIKDTRDKLKVIMREMMN